MVSSEGCYTFDPGRELVESKNRSRTLELRSFSCPNLMHEFEFEIRISDQIQTVKMAVGRHLKFYLNITNLVVEKYPTRGKNNCARIEV